MDLVPNVDLFAFYINAFNEVSTARNSGMGMERLSFTVFHEYAKIYSVVDTDSFMYIMRLMDNKKISIHENKNKPKENDGNK